MENIVHIKNKKRDALYMGHCLETHTNYYIKKFKHYFSRKSMFVEKIILHYLP